MTGLSITGAKRFAAGLALAAAAFACGASAAAPEVEARPPEGANLFVYRVDAQPNRLGVHLWIDLKKVATIRHKRWTALKVLPGPHLIQLRWPSGLGQTNSERIVTIFPDQAYYFEVYGRTGWGSDMVNGGETRMRACCRYTPAK